MLQLKLHPCEDTWSNLARVCVSLRAQMCPCAIAEIVLTRNNLITWIPEIVGNAGRIDMIGLGNGTSCAALTAGAVDLSTGSFLLCDHYGLQCFAQRDCACVIRSEWKNVLG